MSGAGTRASTERRASTDPSPLPVPINRQSLSTTDQAALAAKLTLAHHYSHGISPPRKGDARHPVSSTAGQLFLCAIGMLLSLAVCIWLAAFSTDVRWRRMVFASAAAVCAAVFTLLAVSTVRKNRRTRSRSPALPINAETLLRAHRCSVAGSLIRRNTPSDGGEQGEIRRQSYTGGEEPKPHSLPLPTHMKDSSGHLLPLSAGHDTALLTVKTQDFVRGASA